LDLVAARAFFEHDERLTESRSARDDTRLSQPAMRVVQLGKYYHPYMGGIETNMFVMAAELKREIDLDIVVANVGPRTVRDVVDGVAVTRCGSLGRFASIEATPTMVRELSARKYDVLHVHLPHPVGLASYLASSKPREHRLILTYHSDVVRQKWLMNLYAPVLERALERADTVVATSPQLIEHSPVLTRYQGKCVVVPHGIDLERFRGSPADHAESARIRARFGGAPLLLGVGRLIYYKGFDVAIRALPSVPGAHLILVGEGPLRRELESLARRLGVADRVTLLGEVEHVTPYYLASDIYVLPSVARSEAFGIVQIEAMAAGVPVVNTLLPSGVPFVSRHEETGLTVPPSDPDALGSALSRLLGDPELRRRLGAAGQARAQAEFSQAVLGRRMLAVYQGRAPDAPLTPSVGFS
jgi:glycosyltransferase involved in cell wall biosynthesis